jgi:hypothetical protein
VDYVIHFGTHCFQTFDQKYQISTKMYKNKRKSTTSSSNPPRRRSKHQGTQPELGNDANISEEEVVGDVTTQKMKRANEEKARILKDSTNEVRFHSF